MRLQQSLTKSEGRKTAPAEDVLLADSGPLNGKGTIHLDFKLIMSLEGGGGSTAVDIKAELIDTDTTTILSTVTFVLERDATITIPLALEVVANQRVRIRQGANVADAGIDVTGVIVGKTFIS